MRKRLNKIGYTLVAFSLSTTFVISYIPSTKTEFPSFKQARATLDKLYIHCTMQPEGKGAEGEVGKLLVMSGSEI